MLKGKIITVIVLLFVSGFFTGCPDCEDTQKWTFSNCSIYMRNLDNSGQTPALSDKDTLNINAYGLKIEIQQKADSCGIAGSLPSIATPLYAASPCYDTYFDIPLDTILDLRIITLNDFNSEKPAGSNVTDYFSVLSGKEFYGLYEYTELNQYYYYADNLFEMNAMLMEIPSNPGWHQFRIEAELSDGRVLSADAGEVYLK
jgi:hypothetical protein